jgi:hypothetical protein
MNLFDDGTEVSFAVLSHCFGGCTLGNARRSDNASRAKPPTSRAENLSVGLRRRNQRDGYALVSRRAQQNRTDCLWEVHATPGSRKVV